MISIIIPTLNRHSALHSQLEHLRLQTSCDFEVIIVDQTELCFSSNSIYDFHLKIIHSPTFKSPILARNLGIQSASSNTYLFLDDDILPSPDLVRNATSISTSFSGIPLIVGGITNVRHQSLFERLARRAFQISIYNDPRYHYFSSSYAHHFSCVPSFLETSYISASLLFVNQEALNINYLPTHFTRHILGGDIFYGHKSSALGVNVFLSNLLYGYEQPDSTFSFKSIKLFRKTRLSLHSAWILFRLHRPTFKHVIALLLRATLILLYVPVIFFKSIL